MASKIEKAGLYHQKDLSKFFNSPYAPSKFESAPEFYMKNFIRKALDFLVILNILFRFKVLKGQRI